MPLTIKPFLARCMGIFVCWHLRVAGRFQEDPDLHINRALF
jgi:hypothetical protein